MSEYQTLRYDEPEQLDSSAPLQPLQSRSQSQIHHEKSQRTRYILSALALVVCLISFVIQTETAGYLAMTLNYKKPIFMLYITHSSWVWLWPLQILVLKTRKHNMSWSAFLRHHIDTVMNIADLVVKDSTYASETVLIRLVMTKCLILFSALTVAGSSWYIAINLTTTSDITAIYNCSAFFAYVFSVLLLKEKLEIKKSFSVLLAIIGVFIVAYGDSSSPDEDTSSDRLTGNVIIGAGAVLYGLYEVLYKKILCPPTSVSPRKEALFANVIGTGIGLCTLAILWIALPVLHFTGLETFELPTGKVLWILIISVITNMLFSGGMLVLMSLTSPVLSSVASLLTIFIVAIVDWLIFGTPITLSGIIGGILIIIAFLLLSYATYSEINEEDSDDEEDL